MKKIVLAVLLFAAGPFCTFAQEANQSFDVSDEGKIVVAATGGYSYRLARIKTAQGVFREQAKELKSGYSYQANAYYMFNYRAGLGVEFNTFKSSNTMPGTYDVTAPNGEIGNSKISEDLTLSFYGVGFIFNLMEDSRQKFYFNASFGYLRYKDEAFILDDYTITGGGVGTSVGLTYQYLLFEDFSVGPRINLAGSSLRRFTYKGPDGYTEKIKLSEDNREQLIRLDLGVQLMYRF